MQAIFSETVLGRTTSGNREGKSSWSSRGITLGLEIRESSQILFRWLLRGAPL